MSYREDIIATSKESLPWEKLHNCNILITGATGLIGSCLIEVLMQCQKRGFNVYAMGRNPLRMRALFGKYNMVDEFHTIIGDVTKPIPIDIKFHYIIHAASGAAPIDFSQHPVEVMKANILGVTNLMEYGLSHNMRRFLYVSSGEVYGEGDGRIFDEDYSGYVNCATPRACYPSSKRAAETLCSCYAAEYGADIVIARPCHTYGPNFTPSDNRVYAQFIRNVLGKENIVLKSSGTQYRSWCYVVDCVSALLYVLLKGETGQAYNIADNSSNITIKELAEMIANIGDCKVVFEKPNDIEKSACNPVSKSVFSTNKIEKLGWGIKGNMIDKMRSTIDYVKKMYTECPNSFK